MNPCSSPLVTIVCIIGTLLGIAVNLRMASWRLGETLFGLIVWMSIGLIALGFVPGIKKWRWGRLATRVATVAVGCYIFYTLWVIATYKGT